MTERVVPISFIHAGNNKCSKCLNQKYKLSGMMIYCACQDNPYIHLECLQ